VLLLREVHCNGTKTTIYRIMLIDPLIFHLSESPCFIIKLGWTNNASYLFGSFPPPCFVYQRSLELRSFGRNIAPTLVLATLFGACNRASHRLENNRVAAVFSSSQVHNLFADYFACIGCTKAQSVMKTMALLRIALQLQQEFIC